MKNNLLKSTIIYVLGGAIGPAIPFFLLPIMTKYLSPSDYGILSVLMAFQSFSLYFISFNQHSAYTRFYYEKNGEYKNILMFNNIISVLFISIIFNLMLFITGDFYYILIPVKKTWLYLLIFISFICALELLFKTHLQIIKKPYLYVFLNTMSALSIALITIYMVVGKSYLWQGKLYSMMIYYTIFLTFFVFYFLYSKKFLIKLDKNLLKETFRFGAGLIIGTISLWGMNMSDRFIISAILDVGEVGKYAVAHQFGYIVSIIIASVGKAWSPYFWDNFLNNGEEGKNFIIKTSRLIFIGILFLILIVIFTSPILIRFMINDEYHLSSDYIKWIALGYGVQGMQIIFIQYLSYHKKTLFLSLIILITLILKVIMSYILVNSFGLIGAACSTLICFTLPTIAIIVYAFNLEKEHIKKLFNLS